MKRLTSLPGALVAVGAAPRVDRPKTQMVSSHGGQNGCAGVTVRLRHSSGARHPVR